MVGNHVPHTDHTPWRFLCPGLCLPWKHSILRAGLALVPLGGPGNPPSQARSWGSAFTEGRKILLVLCVTPRPPLRHPQGKALPGSQTSPFQCVRLSERAPPRPPPHVLRLTLPAGVSPRQAPQSGRLEAQPPSTQSPWVLLTPMLWRLLLVVLPPCPLRPDQVEQSQSNQLLQQTLSAPGLSRAPGGRGGGKASRARAVGDGWGEAGTCRLSHILRPFP